MAFEVRKVEASLELGAWFKKERDARGWTPSKASRETNISKELILAMELENWDRLPEGPARKKLILAYARALGAGPSVELAAEREAEKSAARAAPRSPHPIKPQRIITRAHLMAAALLLVGLAIIVYLGFEVKNLRAPPRLVITSPALDTATNHPVITVLGQTDPAAEVKVNGQLAETAGDGNFSARVDLARGANIIEIIAKRGHSREARVYRRVLLEP